MTTPTIPGADSERAMFEAELSKLDLIAGALNRWPDGSYKHHGTEGLWNGWQLARAAAKVGANVCMNSAALADLACPTCNGTGQMCVVRSVQEWDGNGPVMEPCSECGYFEPVGANVAARPDNLLIDVGALLAGFVEEGLPLKRGEARQVLERVRKARIAAGAPDRERSPYVFGVKPSNWAEQVAAGTSSVPSECAPAETPKPVAWEFEYNPSGNPLASWNREVFFHEPKPDPKVRNVRAMCYLTAQPAPAPIAPKPCNCLQGQCCPVCDPDVCSPAPASQPTAARRDLGPSCTCDNGSLRWPCPVHPK